MLFLITKKQKDKILDEYHASLIYVFTICLVALFVVFLISLFPAYLTMRVDREILKARVAPLQLEVDSYRAVSEKNNVGGINNSISILSLNPKKETVSIYKDMKEIYAKVSGLTLVSIQVDAITKTVVVVSDVDNKNTASELVDALNASRYKGANLPYSVFSQNKNFVFSQTLTYE